MRRRLALVVFLASCVTSLAFAWRVVAQGQSQTQSPTQAQTSSSADANSLLQLTGTEVGYGIIEKECTSCHGNPAYPAAPKPADLRQMAPETIYAALKTGSMAAVVGNKLTDEEKRLVAQALSGRLLGSSGTGDAKAMSNRCSGNAPFPAPDAGRDWNGWGAGVENTRFQPANAAGLTADQVPHLKLKWAFGFPGGVSAYGQPTIVGGRVFVASDNGYLYSLDAKTGCVYWSFQAKSAMRAAVSVGPAKGHGSAKYVAYFGDLKANVYAVDAASGNLLWTTQVDDHVSARVTGAPTLYAGRLFVPVSFWEGFAASSPGYPCCTSRGNVVALDANTGKQLWKHYAIPEEPKPVKKNSQGTQLWAPAGASIWNSPTVDAKRGAIYFGTGDAETDPAPQTSDAVVAVDMKTGKTVWTFQGTPDDSFLGGCDNNAPNRSENCPKKQGPDWDFGASLILRTLPNGQRLVVAGQKNGNVFAFDPDRNGELVWKTSVLRPGEKPPDSWGLIVYGGAADEKNAYFALRRGSMAALELGAGKEAWFAPLAAAGAREDAWSAAITAIPGVVFAGSQNGKLKALSASDGRTIWQFDTARAFTTVNGVQAKGGGMASAGPTVAGGMLYVGSGYAVLSASNAGNVLLAFSVE